MAVSIPTGAAVAFDRFWRWLKGHPNCLLRAGSNDVALFDHEMLHWHLYEDEERNPVVQLIMGKALIGELVLDMTHVLFVQTTMDAGQEEPGEFLFEVMGGPPEDATPLYHFLLVHGFEEEEIHHVAEAQ